MMGADPDMDDMDMDMEPTDDMGDTGDMDMDDMDDMAAAEPAAGGEDMPDERAQRESVDPRKLAKTLSKKK